MVLGTLLWVGLGETRWTQRCGASTSHSTLEQSVFPVQTIHSPSLLDKWTYTRCRLNLLFPCQRCSGTQKLEVSSADENNFQLSLLSTWYPLPCESAFPIFSPYLKLELSPILNYSAGIFGFDSPPRGLTWTEVLINTYLSYGTAAAGPAPWAASPLQAFGVFGKWERSKTPQPKPQHPQRCQTWGLLTITIHISSVTPSHSKNVLCRDVICATISVWLVGEMGCANPGSSHTSEMGGRRNAATPRVLWATEYPQSKQHGGKLCFLGKGCTSCQLETKQGYLGAQKRMNELN